jgi:oligoribonuclease NrnB/cAMP/cGMP phosphodiesterase (DHH superfamily)
MTKPDVCIYHNPCADGFTAAWAVHTRWPDVEFVPGAYQAGSMPDVAGKHVLIVDFSYKADVLRQMAEVAASITVLDHHESAERELLPLLEEGIIAGEFDMTRSGAMMAWNYCFPADQRNPFDTVSSYGYVPFLVQYVQDRDLWTWALEDSRAVSAYIQMQGLDFKSWTRLARDLEDQTRYESIVEIGTALVDKEKRDIAGALKASKRRMRIAGHDVPVANVPYIMASEAGNILCKGEPFAALYFDTADGQRSFSLRSDKDDPEAVNVSLIAAQFGGGGHKNASGFRAPMGWEGDASESEVNQYEMVGAGGCGWDCACGEADDTDFEIEPPLPNGWWRDFYETCCRAFIFVGVGQSLGGVALIPLYLLMGWSLRLPPLPGMALGALLFLLAGFTNHERGLRRQIAFLRD